MDKLNALLDINEIKESVFWNECEGNAGYNLISVSNVENLIKETQKKILQAVIDDRIALKKKLIKANERNSKAVARVLTKDKFEEYEDVFDALCKEGNKLEAEIAMLEQEIEELQAAMGRISG